MTSNKFSVALGLQGALQEVGGKEGQADLRLYKQVLSSEAIVPPR